MKYSAKQYAIALYGAVKGKGKKEAEKAMDNFFALLKDRNELSLARKIAEEFENYSLRQEGVLLGEIVSAYKVSEETKKEIAKKMIHKLSDKKIKELNFEEKTDKDLIGGFKIKVEDILVDASIGGLLNKMKRELIKTF